MDSSLPFFEDRHRQVSAEIDDFTQRMIDPLVDSEERDPEGRSREYVRRFAQAGFLKHATAAEIRSIALIRERLSQSSALADSAYAMQGLSALPIRLFGNEFQREEWLPRLESGAIGAFALTEEQAGSDPTGMRLRAKKDGKHYQLTGQKVFISNAPIADVIVVFARTAEGGTGAFSAFVLPGTSAGLTSARIDLLSPHPIGVLNFRDVAVADSARIGAEGDGLRIALGTLDRFRATVGAAACGMAARAIIEALAHVRRREQFGRALASFQTIQFSLAEMSTDLDAAVLLVARAAALADSGGRDLSKAASMAKLFATEHAQAIVDRSLQIHGGRGLLRNGVMERLYRDVRALRIYEGTSEIQKLIIARKVHESRD